MSVVFAAGFFTNAAVHVALIIGAVVAVVSGAVGVFTVMRGQSFAGHAIADVGATGGSASFLVGIAPLWGFVGIGIIAAGAMEMIGIRRARGRDLATGIVLGAGLGLAALFLYFDATYDNTTGAAVTILFGSLFAVTSSTVSVVIAFGAAAIAVVGVLYRPLVLSSVSEDLAATRGVPVRLVGIGYLAALAVAVSLSALTIGAILSTALLVGPAATALRLTKTPWVAAVTAGGIGIAATWVGVLLAYDSFTWPPSGKGWPVSFFVVTLVLVFYLVAQLIVGRRKDRPGRAAQ